jgi:hypothetical protein
MLPDIGINARKKPCDQRKFLAPVLEVVRSCLARGCTLINEGTRMPTETVPESGGAVTIGGETN